MKVLTLASAILLPAIVLLVVSEIHRRRDERVARRNAVAVEQRLAAAKAAGTFKPHFGGTNAR
jgi:hypothetical protein